MNTAQRAARQDLEARFRHAFSYDVAELAAEHCEAEGLVGAALRCRDSHDLLNRRLWEQFAFDWQEVFENPGGTSGRAARLVRAKLEFTVAWAVGNGFSAAEVHTAEITALECLRALWREWAGYMVTSSPEFELALGTH